jgi:hypothetical protein
MEGLAYQLIDMPARPAKDSEKRQTSLFNPNPHYFKAITKLLAAG